MNRLVLLVVLGLLLAACSSAAAPTAVPAPAPAPVAIGAIEIAQRLQADGADVTPAVAGLELPEARDRLDGSAVRVVRVGAGRRVSAQWPEPGAPQPGDEAVTLWVGKPAPPPPPPPEPSRTEAPLAVAAADPKPAPTAKPPRDTPAPPEPTPALEPTPKPAEPAPAPLPPASNGLEPTGEALSGRASWYGPGFEGNRTACGQRFDPGELTLASRELECGTAVRVTGPSGRTVEATVNDWGPAEWTERRFDLSRATFAAVASLSAGVVDVTVEPLR